MNIRPVHPSNNNPNNNNNNNQGEKYMETLSTMFNAPGFDGFQKFMEDNGIIINGRAIIFEQDSRMFPIIASASSKNDFSNADTAFEYVSIDLLLAVGEEGVLRVMFTWNIKDNKFVYMAYPEDFSFWGAYHGYSSNIAKEVFSAWRTANSDLTYDDPKLIDCYRILESETMVEKIHKLQSPFNNCFAAAYDRTHRSDCLNFVAKIPLIAQEFADDLKEDWWR